MLFLSTVLSTEVTVVTAETHWLDTFLDSSWFFVALLLPIIAVLIVKGVFAKYNKVHTQGGRTAAQIARDLLDENGLHHVMLVQHPGNLSDHYNPKTQTVALSDSVYDKDTVGAIAVAAHEVGHAIQHATEYAPMRIRSAIYPVAAIGSRLWIWLFLAGGILQMMNLIWIAIALFAFGVLFQLATLPLELDASRRAMNALSTQGYLVGKEVGGARSVLTAAAFTYVAALIASLIQLLRLLAMMRRR
jgi:hypothetical protein